MTDSDSSKYSLLDQINDPSDLRRLPAKDLPKLCNEVRNYLIATISECGGHFAAGLGAVEITIALHYILDTPRDRLIWDVGHQTYPHKILTGRKERLATIRKIGGLAPFPKRNESEYDVFGTGHSSTAISAATGISLALRQQNKKHKVVAVVGDGGITAGMAYEAMNHLGAVKTDMLIILNDNEMSISPNVGAMTNYLTRIISSRFYTSVMKGGRRLLEPMPPVHKIFHRAKLHLKGMMIPDTLFEELGIHYYGPVDGHNINLLVKTLSSLKNMDTPRLLHIVTRKGKGYKQAEQDPVKYHAVGRFNPSVGIRQTGKPSKIPTYSEVFSRWVCDMAAQDSRLIAITPAMREGSGLIEFEKRFPERYFDVGIAEQHAVTLAAGFACEGIKPVVAIYSTFLQRSYDQLIHDIAIQNLPVLFAVDRAGLVGPDGQTHAGSFDLTYLRCIPNLLIMAPNNADECRKMLSTGFLHSGPSAVRYPRGNAPAAATEDALDPIPIGKAIKRRTGHRIALLSFGATTALVAAETLDATVFDMRFVKPLDTATIEMAVNSHEYLVTVEDNARAGGVGSSVNEYLAAQKINIPVLNLGLPDYFQNHASRNELLKEAGLDAAGIENSVQKFVRETIPAHVSKT